MTSAAFTASVALLSALALAGCSPATVAEKAALSRTHRISGAVSGAATADVSVALTGPSTASTTTSAGGDYAFDGLADGTYTVTPSRAGFTFSPVSRVVVVSGADVASQGFTATALATPHTASGTVSGATSQGVTLTLGGAASGATTTSAGGAYAFAGLADGSYTVTPSRAGYTFSPASRSFTVSGADVGALDFTAAAIPTYAISGTVSGAIAQGVTVTLGGAASATSTTAADGTYSFAGLADGSYTLTPSRSGYTFSPASLAVTVSGASVTGRDFTAAAVVSPHAISGTVSGAIAQGVTVTLSGTASATTTTAANGTYSFAGLADGSYTVTPSRAGYTFSPASLAVTLAGADATGRDFTSTALPTHAISGTVSGAVAQGVTMTLSGASARTTTTASDGTYSFTGLLGGSYTVTPSLTGYTFSPSSLAVTLAGADATGRDFTATASSSTAPVLETGFPVCLKLAGSRTNAHYATTTVTITTGGARHLVVATAWYAFETDPFPLTVTWDGGTPTGGSAWTLQTWPNDGTIHWTAHIFTATASAALTGQSITVTRPHATDYTDALTCIYSFSGAAGFAAATDHHSPMSDVGQNIFVPADVTVQATAAHSILVGVLAAGEIDENHLGTGGHVTARAGTTVDTDNVVPGSGQAAFRMTSPTSAAGSYTIGLTNTNRAYAVEAIEVLAP